MFSLQEQTVKLINVNPRTELHGDEHVLAVDLTLETKSSNDVLSEFDASLKSALYRKADASSSQAGLLDDEPGYLPSLKFPLMGPVKYGWEGVGYDATVHYGISGKDNVVLSGTKVDSFRFECCEGGTVVTKFRVIAHPKTEDIGRLAESIQQEITLSLVPPSSEI